MDGYSERCAEKRSIMSRGQCVARLFGRQPPKGGRNKPQKLIWKMDSTKQKKKKKKRVAEGKYWHRLAEKNMKRICANS